KKDLKADILFQQLKQELKKQEDPSKFNKIRGLFIISVFNKGKYEKDWYMYFQGNNEAPIITDVRSTINTTSNQQKTAIVIIELEDKDLVNFVAGGISGIQSIMSGRVKIVGDFNLAQQLETLFLELGGVEKTMSYIK
ncbi:hypothetical protein K502DRAFT_275284, partial [Neoconidiobolus thromboides FSU 785]